MIAFFQQCSTDCPLFVRKEVQRNLLAREPSGNCMALMREVSRGHGDAECQLTPEQKQTVVREFNNGNGITEFVQEA